MFATELSELIDEIREIEIYNTNPQDWMNYLEIDDYYAPDQELIHWLNGNGSALKRLHNPIVRVDHGN